MLLGGTFYAKKMRDSRYVTMIDPFTQKYGKWGALQVNLQQITSKIRKNKNTMLFKGTAFIISGDLLSREINLQFQNFKTVKILKTQRKNRRKTVEK